MRTAHKSQSHVFCVSAFCINSCSGKVNSGEVTTRTLLKTKKYNKYVSFDYVMRKGGIHQLVVFATTRCGGDSKAIPLNSHRSPFVITDYSKKGLTGTILLEIHDHIAAIVPGCTKFAIIFRGSTIDTPLCVNHVEFHGATSRSISK